MQISTWNVNSINMRNDQLIKWLSSTKPTLCLLQETKCIDEKFPKNEIEELGYNIVLNGQKTFNGVAILSLFPVDDTIKTFPNNPIPEEARYLESVISLPGKALRAISVYVPNGQEVTSDRFAIKQEFLKALHAHIVDLLKLDELLVIGGDFNVAPEDIDSYNSAETENNVLTDISVRKLFRTFTNSGLVDAYRALKPNDAEFTWWDYRAGAWQRNMGMRIDHLLLSPEAADCLVDAKIDTHMRGNEKPSDHVPISCKIKI